MASWCKGPETDFGVDFGAYNPVGSIKSVFDADGVTYTDSVKGWTAAERAYITDANNYPLGSVAYANPALPKFNYTDADISNVLAESAASNVSIVCIGRQVPASHCQADAAAFGGDAKGIYNELSEKWAGFEIPRSEQRLIEGLLDAGKKVVVVFLGKAPLVIPGHIRERLNAVVFGGSCGTYGAQSIKDILFGDVNPSAKLPFSWPAHTGDLFTPYTEYGHRFAMPDFPAFINPVRGPGVGPWPVSDQKLPVYSYSPAYKFMHGLSYSSFEKSNVVVSGNQITVTVTNTSGRDGVEVVPLFCFNYQSKAINSRRALYRLLDFKRVAVAAGQSVDVTFEYDLSDMAMVVGDIHDSHTKQKYLPDGTYALLFDHHDLIIEEYIYQNYLYPTITVRNDAALDVSLENVLSTTAADATHILGTELTLLVGSNVDAW
jgi:hypothetical protein